MCRRLVELLLHASACVLIPALRTVGNIVTGNDQQTQMIINCSVAPCLLALLTHNHKKSIKKEACWTISNVTAGNKDQVRGCVRSCAEKESRSHGRRLPKLTTKQNSLSAPKRLFGSLVFLGHTIALSALISLAGSLVRSMKPMNPDPVHPWKGNRGTWVARTRRRMCMKRIKPAVKPQSRNDGPLSPA